MSLSRIFLHGNLGWNWNFGPVGKGMEVENASKQLVLMPQHLFNYVKIQQVNFKNICLLLNLCSKISILKLIWKYWYMRRWWESISSMRLKVKLNNFVDIKEAFLFMKGAKGPIRSPHSNSTPLKMPTLCQSPIYIAKTS